MEKKPFYFEIDKEQEQLNLALGVSDERTQELEVAFNAKLRSLLEEAKTKKVPHINGHDVVEWVRDISETPGELVLMTYQIDPALNALANPFGARLRELMESDDISKIFS